MDLSLAIVGVVVLAYAITEIVLGLAMHSIIFKTNGFHNLEDARCFVLAIIVSIIKACKQNKAKTERVSVIGGFVNTSIVLLITLCCGVKAVIELFDDPDPEIGPLYFVCAAGGFFVKVFDALFLSGLEVNFGGIDHDHLHAHGVGYKPCSGHRCVRVPSELVHVSEIY
jgi:Co/Zn/Cd efflux system component